MAKKNKNTYNYHQDMVDTFEAIAYRKETDHEWCAHNHHNGLKKEFTESGYGWAMACLKLRDKHKELL